MNNDYVYMCQKAIEIQDLWSPKSGDLYHYKGCFNTMRPNMFGSDINDGIISWDKGKNITGMDYKKNKFWMPRQEDLQTLLLNHYGKGYCISNILHFLDMYIGDINVDSGGIGVDEELVPYFQEMSKIINYDLNIAWLCFTMEKMYNKRWNHTKSEWESL